MKSKFKTFILILLSIFVLHPAVNAYDDYGMSYDLDPVEIWGDDDWDSDYYDWDSGWDDWGNDYNDWWNDYNDEWGWDWDDYYDPPSNSNDYDDNNTSDDDPKKEKQNILDEAVKRLEKITGLKAMEVVIVESRANATYNALTGEITVSESWFLRSKDDQVSVLYHEYTHSINDRPVARMENGAFVTISTDEPTKWSAREIEIYTEMCKDSNPEFVRMCLEGVLNDSYEYRPSNYQLNEIDAYKAQLDGEKNGWWTFSNEERTDYQNRLDQYKASYERALEYEKNNGLNPDGSKK